MRGVHLYLLTCVTFMHAYRISILGRSSHQHKDYPHSHCLVTRWRWQRLHSHANVFLSSHSLLNFFGTEPVMVLLLRCFNFQEPPPPSFFWQFGFKENSTLWTGCKLFINCFAPSILSRTNSWEWITPVITDVLRQIITRRVSLSKAKTSAEPR